MYIHIYVYIVYTRPFCWFFWLGQIHRDASTRYIISVDFWKKLCNFSHWPNKNKSKIGTCPQPTRRPKQKTHNDWHFNTLGGMALQNGGIFSDPPWVYWGIFRRSIRSCPPGSTTMTVMTLCVLVFFKFPSGKWRNSWINEPESCENIINFINKCTLATSHFLKK